MSINLVTFDLTDVHVDNWTIGENWLKHFLVADWQSKSYLALFKQT